MGSGFFLGGSGTAFAVYVLLQCLAVVTLRTTRRRLVVLFPAPAMICVLLWTVYAYHEDASLWPIVMIFGSPLAALAVIAVWIAMWVEERREATATLKQPSRQR